MTQREIIMRTILTTITIVIVAAISPVAFAALEIEVDNIMVSDTEATGSFEVYITTDETHDLSIHQTRINLSPASLGITFTGAEETTTHPYVMPDGEWFHSAVTNGGATIDVGDIVIAGTPTSLNDGDGLFKVNFDITPGAPPYPVFDVTISTDPLMTMLVDDADAHLGFSVDDGEIQIERTGPHELKVTLHGGAGGNWSPANETSTLLLTYGKIGATSERNNPGDNGDITTGWGNDKFAATSEGNYGVYTRGEPFGSGDDMLVQDARELTDTANVLIETYTNTVFTEPGVWIPGETWNDGGILEFEVTTPDKTYFHDFRIVQKQPGRFLDGAGIDTLLGDYLNLNGEGLLPFGRIGTDWPGDIEIDWLIGPFASFDLIPPDGTPWSSPDAPLAVEMGTYLVGHPPTPEPSSFILLAIAGFGVCTRRRRFRSGQG